MSKKNSASITRKTFYKPFLAKFVSAVLIISLLILSVPAAPKTVVGASREFAQDVRFAYLSGGAHFNIGSWFAGLFISPLTTTQQSSVADIKIFPGDVTVNQGENVIFSAAAFDKEGIPVNGVEFQWTAQDSGRGFAAYPINEGKFEPWVFGTFTITAVGGGRQAQTTVTVNQTAVIDQTKKEDSEEKQPIYVSTRSADQAGREQSPESNDMRSVDDPDNLPGNPPGSPADDGATSGNFQVSTPVISLPGRGVDLSLNLVYNSRVWNKSGSILTFDYDGGFPAPGWSLGFGKMKDMGVSSGAMLIDADGTRHPYAGMVFSASNNQFDGYTTDGKFIDYKAYRDASGLLSGVAYFPDGTLITYGARGAGCVYPTRIRDAQGNFITVTYRNNQGPAIETVTDTLGRVITFNYDSGTPAKLLSVTAPRMQNEDPSYGTGATRTLLRLHYKPLTLNYSFASGITPVVNNSTPQVLDAIYYPGTGTGYWFGDTDSYSSYGMIAKVLENRGMTWSAGTTEQGDVTAGQMSKQALYNYPLTTTNAAGRTNGVGLTDAPNYTTLSESWDGRDVNEDAVTTYAFNNSTSKWDGTSSSPARMVSVTQPNGTINRQWSYRTPNAWTDGLVFADETIIMDGTNEVIISSSLVSWQQGDYQTARPSWVQATDEHGKKLKTVYDYGTAPFNQVLRSCDYDDAGATLRCSNAVYENSQAYKGTWYSVNTGSGTVWIYSGGRHILSLPLMTNVENPDGTIASQTNFEYDNYQSQALVNTPGVVQHEASHDPYTTQTVTYQGPCIQWNYPPYGSPYCSQYQIITASAYDAATAKRGNVTKVTSYSDAGNPGGPSGAIYETKTYDINGNLRTSSSACCEQTSIEYTSATQYGYPTSQTKGSADPNSAHRITALSVYDGNTGLIKQNTNANGRTSTVMYNPNTLRPVKSISSTGAYSAFAYNDTAMTVTEEVHESNNNLAGKTVNYLNGLGLIKRQEELDQNDAILSIVEAKYTKYAEEWKQSRPYQTGDTPQWTEQFYDSQGRLIKIVAPDGSETKAFYGETQRPDSASAAIGNTIRVMDPWGRERWSRYDQQGRLVEVVEPNPDRTVNPTGSVFNSGSLMTKYTYNTLGKLTKTEQGSQIREFKYDSLGRLTRQKLAEQTATLNDAGSYVGANGSGAKWGEAFFYDSRSNVIQKNDARGVRAYYSYQISGTDDPLNRLQAVSYDTSGPIEPNLTIHNSWTVTYSYVTGGDKTRLSQIRTDGFLTETFAYDVEGRVSDYTQTVDYRASYPMTVSYLYDTLDRVTEVRYPAAYGLPNSPRKIIQNSYDAASRLSSFKVDGTEVAGNIVYNAADQTTSIKVGAAGANQITETYTFDPQTGLLTNQKAQKTNQTLLDLTYDYNRNNSVGSLNGKTGHLTKVTNNIEKHKDREYEFDVLGRLTSAKGGTSGELWQQSYTYDRYGNRTNVTASGLAADNSPIPLDGLPNLTYNSSNNRITTSGFEYDSAGNQTKAKDQNGNWIRLEYDAANRIMSVKRDSDGAMLQAFQYGSTNTRLMDLDYTFGYLKIFCSAGGTTFSEYTEYVGTVQTWTKSYIFMGNSQLSTVTPNGAGGESVEYNHPDRLGTSLTTNQQNGTSTVQAHLPFGTALNAETTRAESKRFTSYERSAVTGLDYAINRTYDSKQGRFTQVDPIGMSAVSLSSPQTLNLYSYCGNDPINYVDPSGLFWGFLKKLFKWVLTAIAVVVAILTIVAAPATLLGILSAISAAAGAASSVLGALGYRKAAMIFGVIAMITGFGNIIGAKLGKGTFASEGGEGDLSGAWFGIFSGVGSIVNYFGNKKPKKKTEGRGSPAEIRSTFFRLYGAKFIKCLKQIFGKDYKKILKTYGKPSLKNSPVLDTSLNGSQLGARIGRTTAVEGLNDPGYGKSGKVFVSSETYNSRTANTRKAIFGGYAHETANILDAKINPTSATYEQNYPNANPIDPVSGVEDGDTGANVERCVFGGLQYP